MTKRKFFKWAERGTQDFDSIRCSADVSTSILWENASGEVYATKVWKLNWESNCIVRVAILPKNIAFLRNATGHLNYNSTIRVEDFEILFDEQKATHLIVKIPLSELVK
jgi:hypothetical protein